MYFTQHNRQKIVLFDEITILIRALSLAFLLLLTVQSYNVLHLLEINVIFYK